MAGEGHRIVPFGNGIWMVEGSPITAAAGFHYPTRMTVMGLEDGSLILWSPVRFDPDLARAVEDLGRVAWLVAPNSLHDSFIADWHRAFTEARLCLPAGLAAKRPDLPAALVLEEIAIVDRFASQVELVPVPGNRITQETVCFHRASRTAVVTDLIQQLPRDWYSGWRAVVARLDLMTGSQPNVPRKFRLAFMDRDAARPAVRRILDWPAERVIMAHGIPVSQDGQAVLRRCFGWLKA